MGKMLSEEERRHMLEKLESKIVATRFMTLKYISSSINTDKVDFAKMDIEIPEFTKSLVRIIEFLVEKDPEEMVKREAGVCLENLKKKLNPTLMHDVPVCTSCGERLVVSYRFCTKCGVDLKGQKWVATYKLCEKCQNYIDPKWNNCSHCGNVLIKKVDVPKACSFCKKKIEPGWMLCPYCGSRLKLVAGL
ncbi:replication restart DNA helicase PriA [Candidatus Methanoperedens nitroreducens]|uniref:Replication restart DNA helicase PriA n=1 Tax=Candidatus Methanoperedens nitratireducens TaxID=1392998 RepID=A0A062UVT8_9EURY|nr:zinc ribbon domain-containing protein [Candidatus Methanoperedens nitroreducens]KCZ71141.1 replication restart DNA helicase PriA [Candidatus Methanoperedens nitroreducens]MDJ1421481.1 zinc ribbon domain-containing protein [Candidatus Methanoperedens sp.]